MNVPLPLIEVPGVHADSTAYNAGDGGQCYFAAFVAAMKHPEFTRVKVCHGTVRMDGNDGGFHGRMIGHAWIEFDHVSLGTLVLDASHTGRETLVTMRDCYYAAADVGEVLEYETDQAMELGVIFGHVGPWRQLETDETYDAEDEARTVDGWLLGHVEDTEEQEYELDDIPVRIDRAIRVVAATAGERPRSYR